MGKRAMSIYNRVLKFLSFSVACLVSFFAPFQMGCSIDLQSMCCASCAIKKEEEEDRIEVVIDQNKDDK